ncbi:MAG: hypothetical protein JSR78_16765 [Proteobacteria bacterium]|nr:hypothetical protein [Pseudomonadota bacterium]
MSATMKSAKPTRIDGFWHLARRVPKIYAHLDRRGVVKISTRMRISDDPRAIRARGVVEKLDAELQYEWRERLRAARPLASPKPTAPPTCPAASSLCSVGGSFR